MFKRFIIVAVGMCISLAASADSFKIETAAGYKTTASVYKASEPARGITVVMLHGKTGKPGLSFYSGFYKYLRKAGYNVVAPRMPYSRFDADYAQTIAVIDAAVDEAVKRGDRVVIAGHSMGATFSLHYGGNHPRKEIIGIMPIALGHQPEFSQKFQEVTIRSVLKAREMVEAGEGSKKESFDDLNMGRQSSIRMTAHTYLSYYDPRVFPELKPILQKIHVPVFWLSGASDRLRYVYEAEDNFKIIPPNPKSKYLEAAGEHKSVVSKQTKPIINWLNSL